MAPGWFQPGGSFGVARRARDWVAGLGRPVGCSGALEV